MIPIHLGTEAQRTSSCKPWPSNPDYCTVTSQTRQQIITYFLHPKVTLKAYNGVLALKNRDHWSVQEEQRICLWLGKEIGICLIDSEAYKRCPLHWLALLMVRLLRSKIPVPFWIRVSEVNAGVQTIGSLWLEPFHVHWKECPAWQCRSSTSRPHNILFDCHFKIKRRSMK